MNTAIIVINWNGASLTVQCLESLEKAGGDFFTVVVDNGSTDDSVRVLTDACARCREHQAYLLQLDDNYGFAGGNNRGIEYARSFNPDSYLLLNNDTEADPGFMVRLQSFAADNPQYRVLSPRINYWYDKSRIWYCGGELTYGSRRNTYRDRSDSAIAGMQGFKVSFVSGCALFFHSDVLETEGAQFLSERFFFSEEDYEFALRMKAHGVAMACVPDSLVYHKVGMARDGGAMPNRLGKDYNYYLGRLICDRMYYSRLNFMIILLLSLMKSFRVIRSETDSLRDCFKVMAHLASDARKKDGISHDEFQSMAVSGTYFDFLK